MDAQRELKTGVVMVVLVCVFWSGLGWLQRQFKNGQFGLTFWTFGGIIPNNSIP
jgi:hypothetical protein